MTVTDVTSRWAGSGRRGGGGDGGVARCFLLGRIFKGRRRAQKQKPCDTPRGRYVGSLLRYNATHPGVDTLGAGGGGKGL